MRIVKKRLIGLCHRVAYAALVSAIVWIFVDLPLPEGSYPPTRWGVSLTIARWLDLPIAVATQPLPCSESAIDLWFRIRCPEPIGDLWRYFFHHMRVGIPAYVLLFYLPSIYRLSRSWWRQRRGMDQPPVKT